MAEERGPVVERALLKNELVRLRREAEKTQLEVAGALEWSEAKVMRVEGGKTSLTKTDLEGLLKVYGITNQARLNELHELSRSSKRPAWWDGYRATGIVPAYLRYVGYEAGAASIRQCQSSFVPGLLQTPDYARVVTREYARSELVDDLIRLRMERQEKLRGRANRPRETYILDEAVLRRRVGGPAEPGLMVEQLYHLIELSRHDQLNIHIVPFSRGSHFGLRGPFTLLEFQGLDDIVYLEGPGSNELVETADGTLPYKDGFLSMLEGDEGKEPDALDPRESQKLIKAAAEEMLSQR